MYNPFNLQTNSPKKTNPFDIGGGQNESTPVPNVSFQVDPIKTSFAQSTPQTTTRGTFDDIKSLGRKTISFLNPKNTGVDNPINFVDVAKEVPGSFATVVGAPQIRAYGAAGAFIAKKLGLSTGELKPEGQFLTDLYGTDKPISLSSVGRETRLADPQGESKGVFKTIDPALGLVVGTIDAFDGGVLGKISKVLKLSQDAKQIIAGSKDALEIATVLQKEIPELTKPIAAIFGEGLRYVDDVNEVESVLNKLKFEAQRLSKAKGAEEAAQLTLGEGAPKTVKPEVFQDTGELSTTVLSKLEGRETVSKQFISDLTNSPDLKQQEREIIRDVLASYPDGNVPVKEFADKVKAELLPLKVQSSDAYNPKGLRNFTAGALKEEGSFTPKHEGIALPDDIRGRVSTYKENIYESPISTSAGDEHFNYQTKNYFGHTRVEDMANGSTRRVIEVQSDLYQKGNLERETAQAREIIGMQNGRVSLGDKLDETDNFIRKEAEGRLKETAKLQQYSNPTAHFRMVREEVKKAAQDGKSTLLFPTGETAMKIEGLGQARPWYSGARELTPNTLKVGEMVSEKRPAYRNSQDEWIITDVLGDGKFKAVPKDALEEYFGKNLDNSISDLRDGNKDGLFSGTNLEGRTETFDISGKIDTNNPIYRFYEKDLGRYLKSKYNAVPFTDSKGVTWYKVAVSPEAATKPVTAFKKTPIDEMVDFDLSIPEAQKILRTLFDEREMSFITTKNLIEGNAIGRFSTKFLNLIKLVESGGKVPSSTLYHEAFHGYFNVFIPEAERKAILAKVRKNIATLPARVASAAEGYKGADVRAEEWLADDFAKYVKEISAGKKPKSLFADLWERVLDKIRSWIRKTGKFDELYQDILAKKRTGFEEKPGRTEVRFDKVDVDELRVQKEILEESIKSNPARQLAKYANKNGELPEVLGGVSGKFGSSGDDIVTELGFKDSEEARAAYQVYRKQLTRLDELKGLIKETNTKETPPSLNLQETPLQGASAQSDEVQLSELAKETPASQLQEVQEQYKSDTPYHKIIIDTSTPVKQKVGLIDYLRTPDRVLKKIGLENVSAALRKGYEKYLYELPKHIDMITDWSKQVPKESNVKIFRWLDGKEIELNETELRVANEIKEYLGMWAERLNLPEDNQISHYITHIFDIGTKQKEFDEDIAKLIKNKVPGSVYDPFLEQRLGAKGYVEDTWRALDAYVKRGVRKANMDPALNQMKKASEQLEDSQLTYVKRLGDRINMRPTEWDNLLDNMIKQIVGYKFGQRPTAVISGTLRRMVYRGALGLNINSAIKNLTQGVNTFSKLGARDTLIGYINLLKPGSSKELEEVGVLAESFIQDRTLSSTKQLLQKADKGLFVMFQIAEKINRGSAYFGAKAKAIRQGLSEEKAIEYAKKVVRDTQFVFGSIDTPVAMQGDIAKLLTQFMSFPVKQTEFLLEMAKNKEYAGIIRYILASMFVVYTAGQVFDIKGKDFIPAYAFSRFGKPPALAFPWSVFKAVTNWPNQYGQTPSTKSKIKDIIYSGTSLIPGGVQISKTLKGNTVGKNKPKKKAASSSSNPFSI